jgi:hypothetical protein
VPGDPVEVVVIADEPHRPTDRRVNEAVGQAGGAQGGLDRPREEGADENRRAGPGGEPHDLAVVAEPAVRTVGVVEEPGHGVAGGREVAALDDEVDLRPDRPPGGRDDDGYDPPVVTWPPPFDVLAAPGAAWMPEEVVDGIVVDWLPDDWFVVVVVVAVVPVAWPPALVMAASDPNAPTAAAPARAAPTVSVRMRWIALVRSSARRRLADVFMAAVSPGRPFDSVTRSAPARDDGRCAAPPILSSVSPSDRIA